MDGVISTTNRSCVSVTTPEGESYLTETVDTSGHAHTAEYLEEVAMSAVTSTEHRFGCKVGTFVTDNASNMVKMRRQLEADSITPDSNIISYGCSAHYFNLLAKDVEIPGVKEHYKILSGYPSSRSMVQNCWGQESCATT